MAQTTSRMVALGTRAPDFDLYDAATETWLSLEQLKSDTGTVVMFICNHCPFVQHIQSRLVDIADAYMSDGISFIAISSNDITDYPQDAPEKMRGEAKRAGYNFPYLFDETQNVAKAYGAECTPDFFVYDENLRLVYRGRFDAATPGNSKAVTGRDLAHVLDSLVENEPVTPEQFPSVGCNIKWRAREETFKKAAN